MVEKETPDSPSPEQVDNLDNQQAAEREKAANLLLAMHARPTRIVLAPPEQLPSGPHRNPYYAPDQRDTRIPLPHTVNHSNELSSLPSSKILPYSIKPNASLTAPVQSKPNSLKRPHTARARQSCVRCREQKLKCSGEVPCSRCVHRNMAESCQLWHRPTGRPKKTVDPSESLEAISFYSNLEGAVVRVLVPKANHVPNQAKQQLQEVNQQLRMQERLLPKEKQPLQKVRTVKRLVCPKETNLAHPVSTQIISQHRASSFHSPKSCERQISD